MAEIYKNTTLTVGNLINKIEAGELGLPELQRPFVWKDTKVRDLFDSMMRGYPIWSGQQCLECLCRRAEHSGCEDFVLQDKPFGFKAL